MVELRVGWERVIIPWDQVQPDGAGDFSRLGTTLSASQLQRELERGTQVVGLLEFTPDWAAEQPEAGKRSPPRNLGLPFDHPDNYWGRFVGETVAHYAGRIDSWILWNEPEFRPGDAGAGGSFTWLGSDEEFARLLEVGYRAAKRANPRATVSFPGTSYWVDLQSNRTQYYERILRILASDPSAVANGMYHDLVALNLYRAPDDVYRVHQQFREIQQRFGIDKPIWLTETNAMPSDDRAIACSHADSPIQTTMDQQAAYAIQAMSLAAAAGYQRFAFYQMLDQDVCAEPAVWGLFRDDRSRRPVADALRTVYASISGFTRARFEPLVRESQRWSPWPDDPQSLMPNWQVYQVVFDKPGQQRVTVLWNGDGAPVRARVRKTGASATLLDWTGAQLPAREAGGWWVVDLAPATAHYPEDPPGYHFIGGDPLLLIESGVESNAPLAAPALGEPGSVPREFRLFPSPTDQTVGRGQAADFYVSVRGYEGFDAGVSFSVSAWHTQRFPQRRDAAELPLGVHLPASTMPGQTGVVRVTTEGADTGIYFLTLQAQGGGQTRTFDLALVVN